MRLKAQIPTLTSKAILARHTVRNLHHFLISWIDTCHWPPHQSIAFVTTLCWWTLSSRRIQHFQVLQLWSVCSVQLVKFWTPAVVVFLMSTLTSWSSWETALKSQVNNCWTLMYWPLTFGWCTVHLWTELIKFRQTKKESSWKVVNYSEVVESSW